MKINPWDNRQTQDLLDRLRRDFSESFARGVYYAALRSDYTHPDSSRAYDEHDKVFEAQVKRMEKAMRPGISK